MPNWVSCDATITNSVGFFYAMQNTGQILRSKKTAKSKYTPITNDILQSDILTPEEKSILVHLLSLPEDWVVYKGEIWRKMNMGRDRFNKHWKTLVEKGYIVSVRLIDTKTNLIVGWNHIVYEEPVLEKIESTELPTDGESESLNFSKSESQSVYKGITEQSNNKQSNNYLDGIKKSRPKFIPPTLEQVKEYIAEKKINIDAEHFINFYESTNWYRGKTKISNWKACVNTWNTNSKHKQKTIITTTPTKYFNYDEL